MLECSGFSIYRELIIRTHLGQTSALLGYSASPDSALSVCLSVCLFVSFFHSSFLHFTSNCTPLSSQSHLYKSLSHLSPSLPLREGEAHFWWYHTLGHPVTGRLNASSPTKAQLCSPVRGRESNGRHLSQRQLPLQSVGDIHENQAAHLLQVCWGS